MVASSSPNALAAPAPSTMATPDAETAAALLMKSQMSSAIQIMPMQYQQFTDGHSNGHPHLPQTTQPVPPSQTYLSTRRFSVQTTLPYQPPTQSRLAARRRSEHHVRTDLIGLQQFQQQQNQQQKAAQQPSEAARSPTNPTSEVTFINSTVESMKHHLLTGVKKRTKTTPEQLAALRSAYAENPSLRPADRQLLAERINMSPKAVAVWFQNRKNAERRKRTLSGDQSVWSATVNQSQSPQTPDENGSPNPNAESESEVEGRPLASASVMSPSVISPDISRPDLSIDTRNLQFATPATLSHLSLSPATYMSVQTLPQLALASPSALSIQNLPTFQPAQQVIDSNLLAPQHQQHSPPFPRQNSLDNLTLLQQQQSSQVVAGNFQPLQTPMLQSQQHSQIHMQPVQPIDISLVQHHQPLLRVPSFQQMNPDLSILQHQTPQNQVPVFLNGNQANGMMDASLQQQQPPALLSAQPQPFSPIGSGPLPFSPTVSSPAPLGGLPMAAPQMIEAEPSLPTIHTMLQQQQHQQQQQQQHHRRRISAHLVINPNASNVMSIASPQTGITPIVERFHGVTLDQVLPTLPEASSETNAISAPVVPLSIPVTRPTDGRHMNMMSLNLNSMQQFTNAPELATPYAMTSAPNISLMSAQFPTAVAVSLPPPTITPLYTGSPMLPSHGSFSLQSNFGNGNSSGAMSLVGAEFGDGGSNAISFSSNASESLTGVSNGSVTDAFGFTVHPYPTPGSHTTDISGANGFSSVVPPIGVIYPLQTSSLSLGTSAGSEPTPPPSAGSIVYAFDFGAEGRSRTSSVGSGGPLRRGSIFGYTRNGLMQNSPQSASVMGSVSSGSPMDGQLLGSLVQADQTSYVQAGMTAENACGGVNLTSSSVGSVSYMNMYV
ncbi:hypothetical protein BJ742DRAFT_173751 [Cladochytrium replicatum]|nr:hypothetical protein BJ742DRAFT_173751 [Cladochytrium replicatum]